MKISYSISLDDYRALQPEFTARAGHNAGFNGVLIVCILMALLGVYCMAQGLGVAVGVFLIGLGALALAVAYLFERRAVHNAKEKYLQNISTGYRRLHCPDQRTFETDENGFTAGCKCGIVTRPWPELLHFSETPQVFVLGTKGEIRTVPKLAFHSEGEITEFRRFALEKLNTSRSLSSRPIDFTYTKQDLRRAYFVHLARAGGWRPLLKGLATLGMVIYAVFAIWGRLNPHRDNASLIGLLGALVGIPLIRIVGVRMGNRRKQRAEPLRIYAGEEGLNLQDSTTVARNSWKQFIGYLEDDQLYLLYRSPRNYRIIPKRALKGQEQEFRNLLKAKLQQYNYRTPSAVVSAGP